MSKETVDAMYPSKKLMAPYIVREGSNLLFSWIFSPRIKQGKIPFRTRVSSGITGVTTVIITLMRLVYLKGLWLVRGLRRSKSVYKNYRGWLTKDKR